MTRLGWFHLFQCSSKDTRGARPPPPPSVWRSCLAHVHQTQVQSKVIHMFQCFYVFCCCCCMKNMILIQRNRHLYNGHYPLMSYLLFLAAVGPCYFMFSETMRLPREFSYRQISFTFFCSFFFLLHSRLWYFLFTKWANGQFLTLLYKIEIFLWVHVHIGQDKQSAGSLWVDLNVFISLYLLLLLRQSTDI